MFILLKTKPKKYWTLAYARQPAREPQRPFRWEHGHGKERESSADGRLE